LHSDFTDPENESHEATFSMFRVLSSRSFQAITNKTEYLSTSNSIIMKRSLTLIVLWLSFLTVNAQYYLYCAGTITNSFNGSPIPNHEVIIMSDSTSGTSGFFYDVTYTNSNGFYADTIIPPNQATTGTVIIKTMDCQNYYNEYTATFNPTNSNILHDFSICYNNSATCAASFYAYADSVSSPYTFHFVDVSTSSSYVVSWTWDFGDGTYQTIAYPGNPNVTHTYPNTSMVYTACLSIQSYDGCTNMSCQNIAIQPSGCHADFSYYDTTNVSTLVQFLDNSYSSFGPITSWSWNFGDPASGTNNFSTQQNPIHNFTAAGSYHVNLSIMSGNVCFDSLYKVVEVGGGSGCQANFTYQVDSTSVPAGTPVYFTDLSYGSPTQWVWSFGDGTSSTDQNPVHYYYSSGTYYICLTISGINCQDSYCTYVTINTTPGCSSYFTYNAQYLNVSFQGFITNNYGGGVYYWDFGDGSNGTGQTVTHSYANYGTYSVTLTATDSVACSSTYTQSVTVYDSLQTHQVYGQVLAGGFPAVSGMVMIFSLDTTANYTPYVEVATIDTAGTYYFTMVPDGNYYIYAIPILPSGYLPTYYGDVLFWESATLVPLGQAVNPYNINLIPADSSLWGNGNINGQVSQGQLKEAALDKITMLLMNENKSPIKYYQVENSGSFTFPSLALGTYWLKAEIPGVTSDLIQVTLTEENPTANVVMTFTGNKILGIDEPAPDVVAGILYPNPVSESAHLVLSSTKTLEVRIDLSNLAGQSLYHSSKNIGSGETLITIPTGQLPKGIYLLQIRSESGMMISRKIVK
jgi:PKD repeat protein